MEVGSVPGLNVWFSGGGEWSRAGDTLQVVRAVGAQCKLLAVTK